jgi:DNA modification methylase
MGKDVQIIQADVFGALAGLPNESVDTVVTSPPYWGLRDYGVDGQIGLEPTLAEHIAVVVRLFAEIHRVLRPHGTVWLNYGDCYASSVNGRSAADTKAKGSDDRTFRDKPFSTVQGVLKPKDLCMVPNRVAIALQEAGWWVRSEIIWAKPNPMPESITDRPATSHEKIWLLTKSARYNYYAEAVRVERVTVSDGKMPDGWDTGPGAHHRLGREKGQMTGPKTDKQRGHSRRHAGFNERWNQMSRAEQSANGRNLRNYEPPPMQVWSIATKPFSQAHFATFPPELVQRCLLAGSKPGDVVLDPFGGAGTTGLVAAKLGRSAILIEINPEYVDIATGRLRAELVSVDATEKPAGAGPLFDAPEAAE